MILNVDASYSTETGVGAWAVHQGVHRGKAWRLLASAAEYCASSGHAEECAVRLAFECLGKVEAEPPHVVRCDCEPVVARLRREGAVPEGVKLVTAKRADMLHPHQVSRAVRSAFEAGLDAGRSIYEEGEL